MSDIIVLQNVHSETLGTIADALDARGLTYRYVRTFADEPVPRKMENAVGLVALGGPMGVYEQDRYPFLADQMSLMEEALGDGLPILGLCLGSQLLATVLGSTVAPGPRQEIGWLPVTLTEDAATDALWQEQPQQFAAFHWHGDVFDVPSGAFGLASSEVTACRAFRLGVSAYGIVFHLEVKATMVRNWTTWFREDLDRAGVDAATILDGIRDHCAAFEHIGRGVFGNWADLVLEAKST